MPTAETAIETGFADRLGQADLAHVEDLEDQVALDAAAERERIRVYAVLIHDVVHHGRPRSRVDNAEQ